MHEKSGCYKIFNNNEHIVRLNRIAREDILRSKSSGALVDVDVKVEELVGLS